VKIGLNATCFNDRPSGAKQRFIGLYNELFKLMPETHFVIFEPQDCKMIDWFDNHKNISFYSTPIPSEGRLRKFVKGVFFWNYTLKKEKFDIFEGFNLPMIKNFHGKSVMTIHDLRGLMPEYSFLYRKIFKLVLFLSFKRCNHVITGSKIIKKDIEYYFPFVDISVIYNGISREKFIRTSDMEIRAIQKSLNLPKKFILAVGHFERRKNYIKLLNAISSLDNEIEDCYLVIIGNNNGELSAVEHEINLLDLNDKVKIYSGLSDIEVYSAYKACSIFIFPSLYEGFGIPILEAMNAKAPTLLSNLEVFKEITENKLTYFDPLSTESMKESIYSHLSNDSLREKNIEYGEKRINSFTFNNIATQVEHLYRALHKKDA